MDVSTKYMGLELKSPIIVSSSGITRKVENIKKCAGAGAGAVVLKSLYEEQILADKDRLTRQDDMYFWYQEAIDFVDSFSKEDGVNNYLQLVKDAKQSVDIPVIASINCSTPREWPAFAKEIEAAGADALELNILIPSVNYNTNSQKIEDTYFNIIENVLKEVNIPVGVKMGYFFTNLGQTILKLSNSGIKGLVLFNRFFRPDIDVENSRLTADNIYSGPEEITLALRWVSLLSGKAGCDIAGATGIHTPEGVIKHLLSGASAVQVCSTLYKNGVKYIKTMNEDLEKWMEKKNYSSIADFKGKITKDPDNSIAFERVHFMRRTTLNY